MPVLVIRDTHLHVNDRIRQFRIVKKQPEIQLTEVDHLDANSRGGFGSTGLQQMFFKGEKMSTQQYRTRTVFQETNNRKAVNVWNIGLDIGYSGVKVYSGNMIACFPSYATRVAPTLTQVNMAGTEQTEQNIRYRDENGNVWSVGAMAQDAIDPSDTSAGSNAIYGRERYYTPLFTVLLCTGLAAGIRKNQYGDPTGKKLHVVTGLPPKYFVYDKPMLTEVLCREYHFDVKFGASDWEHYDIFLQPEDIDIIDQPEGTLFSIAANSNMGFTPDAVKYFSSKLLIMDPGFGTLDLFPIVNGCVNRDNSQTFPEFGMRQVFKDTCNEILDTMHTEISVPALQQFLKSGFVRKRDGRKITKAPFDDILEKHSRDICMKALDKVIEIYNPTLSYDYFVITGGTGEAWAEYIRESDYFKDSDAVKIIAGNQGDESLGYLFSNARGYYIYAFSKSAAQ